jgi:hypothetical protein
MKYKKKVLKRLEKVLVGAGCLLLASFAKATEAIRCGVLGAGSGSLGH